MRPSPISLSAQTVVTDAEIYVRQEYPRIRSYLIVNGCPLGLADEITNDTSKIVLDRWDRLRGDDPQRPGPPRSYVFKTATRLWHRRGPKEAAWNLSLADPIASGLGTVIHTLDLEETITERVIAVTAVHTTLGRLEVPKRQVLWLRHAETFDTEETARILRIPVGTVKTRLAAAVKQFKELLLTSGVLRGTSWGVSK